MVFKYRVGASNSKSTLMLGYGKIKVVRLGYVYVMVRSSYIRFLHLVVVVIVVVVIIIVVNQSIIISYYTTACILHILASKSV